MDTATKFWRHVKKTPRCWLWVGGGERYGKFSIKKSPTAKNPYGWVVENAHRVSWMLAHGDIPPGMCVLHSCDNPRCVRPDHLFLGTNLDNQVDMLRKRRQRRVAPPKGHPLWKGKLTIKEAEAIFRDPRKQAVVARDHGVCRQMVWRIKTGRSWRFFGKSITVPPSHEILAAQ